MTLSRKISPLWAVVAGGSLVGGITLGVFLYTQHEPVVLAPHSPTTSHQNNSVSGIINASLQDGTLIPSVIPREPWRATFDQEIDDKCGSIQDAGIADLKAITTAIIENKDEELNGKSFNDWASADRAVKYLRSKFGKATEACIHPTLFSDANMAAQKRKVFEAVNEDMRDLNAAGASAEDRYEAWRHMRQIMMDTTSTEQGGFIQRQDFLNHIGYDQDKFFAVGQELGQPFVDAIVAEVSHEIRNPFQSFTPLQVEDLYKKTSRARLISSETRMNDEKLNDLLTALSKWKPVTTSASLSRENSP